MSGQLNRSGGDNNKLMSGGYFVGNIGLKSSGGNHSIAVILGIKYTLYFMDLFLLSGTLPD